MDQLQKSLNTCVKLAIDQYIERLVSDLNVDKEKALAVWNSSAGEDLKVIDAPKKAAPAKKAASSAAAPAKRAKKEDGDVKKCQYVYVKGDKEGESCSAKVSDESETGCFCKKHLAHEKKGDEKKSSGGKKTTAAPKKAVGKKKAEAKEAEADAVSNLKETAPVFSVKMNKWRNYEHEGTGLLFDRKTEEVYGRQKSDGTVVQLTLDDIETCKNLGFKFRLPERLVSKDEKETEEEEEEIVDSDDQEEEDQEDD